MTVTDDIAAIAADTSLSAAEKRRKTYQLKSTSLADALAPFVGSSFNYLQRRITLLQLLAPTVPTRPDPTRSLTVPAGGLYAKIILRNGTQANSPIIFPTPANPFGDVVVINPPIRVPDGAGGVREDLIAACTAILGQVA